MVQRIRREHHPLGIERASHITTGGDRDLDAAKKFYVDNPLEFHRYEAAGRKRSAYVAIGEGRTIVELAQPISSDTPEARDLEKTAKASMPLYSRPATSRAPRTF